MTNTGNAALAMTGITASGDFSQTNTCGSSVAAGANCTITVTFTPTEDGSRTGLITLTDNAGTSPQSITVAGMGGDFEISTASPSATVAPGAAANYSLDLQWLNGINQPINFTCTGAPAGATCSVNPSSVTPSGTGTVIAITVNTSAPASIAPNSRRVPPVGPDFNVRIMTFLWLGLLTLALWAYGSAHRRPRLVRLSWAWRIAALVVLLLALAACGGGGGGSVPQAAGTPAGTYTLTITGTASGSSTLQHTMTLTLNVS
jgi:hypothetical protein